jgi:hypothetical protein
MASASGAAASKVLVVDNRQLKVMGNSRREM